MSYKKPTEIKEKLHPRNQHRQRYHFLDLTLSNPNLKHFLQVNNYGDESIDFFDPEAVRELNRSLVFHYYGMTYWDFPKENLCPAVPGRADYIHYVADLFDGANEKKEANKMNLRCLDIGVGASCIYPILGIAEYQWTFVGSDIDSDALASCQKIIDQNKILQHKIELRKQKSSNAILNNIVRRNEKFNLVICNPPFHSSGDQAQKQNLRKVKNLSKNRKLSSVKNFGGHATELWCPGGEKQFISNLIQESREFPNQVEWFSTLVSKEANGAGFKRELAQLKPKEVKWISMGQGNKTSHMLAWRF